MAGLGRIWVPSEGPSEWPTGWRVHHVEETGSTNADLLRAYARGLARDRVVLAADHQSEGRGRLDRRWDAPSGTGLLVSILFESVPEVPAELTHRLGLAAVRAVRGLLADRRPPPIVGLKWPNDVLVDDRKLAGVLAQRAAGGVVVVGLGLNVRWAPPGAAQLAGGVSPAAVLHAVLTEYDALPDPVGELYRDELLTLGRRVSVELPGDGFVTGIAVDVDPNGRLVVRDESSHLHHLDVGDVVHAHDAR
ncbi:MAG: biotin--[acetyl-CoA-carboxylase] ligase [Acidimicrobiia bacterium]|nr:biotin--[acetyl-CoA-carboxylase] ligase [Acidimicrobiia bacterium]